MLQCHPSVSASCLGHTRRDIIMPGDADHLTPRMSPPPPSPANCQSTSANPRIQCATKELSFLQMQPKNPQPPLHLGMCKGQKIQLNWYSAKFEMNIFSRPNIPKSQYWYDIEIWVNIWLPNIFSPSGCVSFTQ